MPKLIMSSKIKKNNLTQMIDSKVQRGIQDGKYREQGGTGTVFYSGEIYNPDYLSQLSGQRRMEIYDEMRWGDTTIFAGLRATINPLLALKEGIKESEDTSEGLEARDFATWNIFQGLRTPWASVKQQAYQLKLASGVMVFELVWGGFIEWEGKQKFYLKDIAPRMPRTIVGWYLDTPNNEGRYGIEQEFDNGERAFIDLELQLSRDLTLPRLIIITNDQEGGNYEGKSILRPCYGAWTYKKNLQIFDSIQKEKMSLAFPKVIMGRNVDSQTKADLEEWAKNVRNNESAHLAIKGDPEQIVAEMMDMKGGGIVEPLKSAEYYDEAIGRGMGIAFLMNRNTGSQARTETEAKFFLMERQKDVKQFTEIINKKVIEYLTKINYNLEKPPVYYTDKLSFLDINELSTAFERFTRSKAITIDRDIENNIREEMGYAEISEEDWEEKEEKKKEIAEQIQGDKAIPKEQTQEEEPEQKEPVEASEEIKSLILETNSIINEYRELKDVKEARKAKSKTS